eukprot:2786224-Rhodomonas_salina.1
MCIRDRRGREREIGRKGRTGKKWRVRGGARGRRVLGLVRTPYAGLSTTTNTIRLAQYQYQHKYHTPGSVPVQRPSYT